MTLDALRFEIQRVDAEIRLELELIGQRMGWLAISHSFLFSAFTLEVVSDASPASRIRMALRYSIPIIALLSAVTGGLSILAAQAAGRGLRRQRQQLEQEGLTHAAFRRERAPARWITSLGNLPPQLMPWALSAIWSILLGRVLFY